MASIRTEFVAGAPRLAVDVAGRGPLVVFLHGIGGNKSHWEPQLPVFAERFTAAAWDARGYGESGDYPGDLDFADFSADLLRLIDHFGAERAHLCGLSMGGRIAQDFYRLHPERVATMVLCDTFAGADPEDPRAGRAQSADAFAASRIQPYIDGADPADRAREAVGWLLGPNRPAEAFARAAAAHAALRVDSYIKTVRASADWGRARDLPDIAVPVLLVFGAQDPLTPPRVGEYMREKIPGARLEVIEDCGHLSNLERPEAFNRAVLAFLSANR